MMLAAASSKRALMLCAPAVVLAGGGMYGRRAAARGSAARPVKYVEVAAQAALERERLPVSPRRTLAPKSAFELREPCSAFTSSKGI